MSETKISTAKESRRGFFGSFSAWLAAAVGAVIGVGPVCVGLYTFIMEPLRKKQMPRKERDGGSSDPGFFRVASVDEIATDVPRRFTIVADKLDAWNFMKDQALGAVYLQKNEAGDISCYHTTCPHAGCSVAYEQDSNAYHCPCHNSSFNLDGSKLENGGSTNPSPRPLDTLEIKVDEATNTVFVKYEDYYTGRHDKVAK
ncbi:MAG: hypothetical protein CMM06_09520 [Rhodopirellula sp.]|nr:hypothetical protein [Rhodopirellula sp.]MBL99915.1 hypothetical protein [Rhodopirellula sp.]|tara:strand:+ start:13800 stop:14399 length:600 start_codon:yes stop_codon:yes gene_type:complete